MLRSNISIKKKTADSIKWGIHKETGLPVWIDDVEANGLACNCCCPVCGVDLKACTLGKKQQHHYRHRANNDCYYSNDIAVYKWLHNQLTSAKTLCVPATFTYVGWTRQMITNRRIVEIRDIQFHADINHFPPLLIAEIDGILTRILVSTPYYFDKSDYSQFVQEAKENNWQCLEFFLPENFSFSDIPDFGYLKTFLFHSADACHWIYNRDSFSPFMVEVAGFEPAAFWSRTVAFCMNKNQIKQIVLISYCFFQWFGVGLHQVLSPSKRGIIDLFLCKQLYSYLFVIAFRCFFMPSTTCSGPTIVT